MRTLAAVVACVCLAGASTLGADGSAFWPQWRGPEGTGVAPHADPPLQWSEDLNVRWKLPLPGKGHASPVVWDERVFVLTAIETDKKGQAQSPASAGGRRGRWMKPTTTDKLHRFDILALDRADGSVVWQRTACEQLPHEGTHGDGSWASNSPVTDGERVYAYFGSRGLYCFDMTGAPRWQKDLGRLTIKMRFGEGSSPVLYDDKIIVVSDHEGQSYIVALDKLTGDELWRVDRDEITAWATPLVVAGAGEAQIITSATKRVRSYDAADGAVIWECGGMTGNVIPTPVAANGLVYVMSGFRGSALRAIRFGAAQGDITGSDMVAWSYDRDTPYTPSPLLYGDTLYFLKTNTEVLTCLDATTGSVHYGGQRLGQVKGVYASPVGARDRVYIVGRNGVTQVLKRGPAYEVLAENALDDSFSASPALAGGELYLRGHKSLYCIAAD